MGIGPGGIAGIGGGLSLLGGKKGKKGAENAQERLTEFWQQAQEEYLKYFEQALEALGEGKEESLAESENILKGLGMSREERLKFYDIAREEIDWIIDFGKKGRGEVAHYQGEARDFLSHYKGLLFNPDAIYGTEVYKNLKGQALEEWSNFYSGKGGLGGNAQAAMGDRIARLGYEFRQGELDNAYRGFGASQAGIRTGLDQVGLGAQASTNAAELAFRTGEGNARDINQAYGDYARARMGAIAAFNPAGAFQNAANTMFGGLQNYGSQFTNLGFAGDLSGANALGGIGNALLYGGLGGMFPSMTDTPTDPMGGVKWRSTGYPDRYFMPRTPVGAQQNPFRGY